MSSSLASTCASGYEDDIYNNNKDQQTSWLASVAVVGLLRSLRRKETDRRRLLAFHVGGNAKWVLRLAALLESDFAPKTSCTTHFGYVSL